MHVLLLTHIFWPEIADFKSMPLARELVKQGHKVTVLTAFPNYPLGRLYDGYTLSWRQWEYIDGVSILRVPLYPDHSSSGFKRVLNYGSFTLASAIIGVLLIRKIDVVFVYSPPMTLGFTANLFKLMHKAPVLLDVVDLWPEAIAGSGMVSGQLIKKGAEWIARVAYRIADKITVPTKGFYSRLVELSVPETKIAVMPHWADKRFYYEAERDKEFGEKYDLNGKSCIIHTGNIGPFQNIENIITTAELLRDVEQLRIILVGGGRDLEKLKELKELRRLENIVFTGVYPVEKMSGILAWADALLVSLRSDPYLSINLPGKMPGYMAAGRPIIACTEGEVTNVVVENSLGMSCMPDNPYALCNTIREFLNLPLQERLEMGRNCRLLFSQKYDKDVLIGGYIKTLEELNGCRKLAEGAIPGR